MEFVYRLAIRKRYSPVPESEEDRHWQTNHAHSPFSAHPNNLPHCLVCVVTTKHREFTLGKRYQTYTVVNPPHLSRFRGISQAHMVRA